MKDEDIAKAVVRKHKGGAPKGKTHSNQLKFGEEMAEPGDNSRFLRYALVGINLPPIDISDPKQVEQRINDYFTYCIDNDRKPNIRGLGNWLGVDSETVMRWRRGQFRGDSHQKILQKAVAVLEEMWWDYGYEGKVNPANWIFIGKNAYGMKDQQDIVVTPNQAVPEAQDPDTIAEKYALLEEPEGSGE